MRVHLTCDVEVWCDGWDKLDRNFSGSFRRYIYGPPPGEHGALPLFLKILQHHGIRAVFFVETLFSYRFGLEPLRDIVELLLSHGQEVQLHVHTEWLDELPLPLVASRSKTPYLHTFDRSEQSAIIAAGLRRLEEAGAPRPTAFRAGNFSANADTLRVLAEHGFTVDSSINAAFDFLWSGIAPHQRLHCSRIEGMVEFPVTQLRDGFGVMRPMQIGACSASEIEQALVAARDQGLPAATLLSHNFELLSEDQLRPDRIAIKRFERICAWLAQHGDEFSITGFDPGIANAPAASASDWQWPRATFGATGARHVEQIARRLSQILSLPAWPSARTQYQDAPPAATPSATPIAVSPPNE